MKIKITKIDSSDAAVGVANGDIYDAIIMRQSEFINPYFLIDAPKQKGYHITYDQAELVTEGEL